MNSLEKKMLNTLIDLKENHHVLAVKAEFEAEGTRLEEAMRLKEVVTKAGLDLVIKIGGCEAIKDMLDAKVIGVNGIVAPMIETAYALKKYVKATKFVFPEEEYDEIDFFINIETITGFNNALEMLKQSDADCLSGIIMGRVDMTGSMGLSRENINSVEILKIAKRLNELCGEYNKKFVVGGGVSAHSIPFFKELSNLTKFETRKIIFDAPKAIADLNADKGILKAVGFELMWLKNKRDFYGMIHNEDNLRLEMLEKRYKQAIIDAGGVYA